MDDIEAIKQLKARYFRTMDSKDWAAMREVFADDAMMDTVASGGNVISGADEIIVFLQQTLADVVTVHHGHMPELELTSPTTATGVWSMEDMLRWPDGRELHGYGHYHEGYEKADGRWRIKTLTLTRLRMDVTEPVSQTNNPEKPNDPLRPYFYDVAQLPGYTIVDMLGDSESAEQYFDLFGRDLLTKTILRTPQLSVFHETAKPGEQVKPHRHGTLQMTYVLRGELIYGNQRTAAGMGHVNPDTLYSWRAGEEGAEWIEIHSGEPGIFTDRPGS